jgi:hypothetical protein
MKIRTSTVIRATRDQLWPLLTNSQMTTPLGTQITRITSIAARGFLPSVKEGMFYFGLKRVHLFVFKNWRNQAE